MFVCLLAFGMENPVKVSGKTELSRAEKIEKYLQARPDHNFLSPSNCSPDAVFFDEGMTINKFALI